MHECVCACACVGAHLSNKEKKESLLFWDGVSSGSWRWKSCGYVWRKTTLKVLENWEENVQTFSEPEASACRNTHIHTHTPARAHMHAHTHTYIHTHTHRTHVPILVGHLSVMCRTTWVQVVNVKEINIKLYVWRQVERLCCRWTQPFHEHLRSSTGLHRSVQCYMVFSVPTSDSKDLSL